jgi:hypothetical protein
VIPGRKPNDVYFPAVEMEERDLCWPSEVG